MKVHEFASKERCHYCGQCGKCVTCGYCACPMEEVAPIGKAQDTGTQPGS